MVEQTARGFAPRYCHTSLGLLLGASVSLLFIGCATPWFNSKPVDEEPDFETKRLSLKELLESDDRPRLIREVAPRPRLTLSRLENVGLVTNLPGTGGKVNPSKQREDLLAEIRKKDVKNPNQWLDSKDTAMVVVEALVPPSIRVKDHLDVTIRLSSHAEATDLQGGWLLDVGLKEMSLLGGHVREGFEYADGRGQIVTQAQIRGLTKPEDATTGIIVGGALVKKPRTIGLYVEEKYAHAITMATIVPAINKRFTVFDGIKQVGVATPTRDTYIDLEVPPKYQADPFHYATVVSNIGILETADELRARIELCRKQLQEPTTARLAACQLEAIGKEGIPLLLEALQHPNKEIRFYAAHSLGYLNDFRAIKPLLELAQTEPAFRAMAINAVTVIDRFEAHDGLEQMLHCEEPEVRYGAVRALRSRDAGEPLVAGEQIGDTGKLLSIPSSSSPLVAVSLSRWPEVVVFGDNPPVKIPAFLYVNPRLLLREKPNGRIAVSNLVPGREDRLTECSSDLRSILVAISEVGGNYGDWVNVVRLLGEGKHLAAQVAMNPVPISGRTFDRDEEARSTEPGDMPLEGALDNVPVVAPPPELTEANKSRALWYNPKTWFTP